MATPTDLQSLGRAFLAALVARLGHQGAAAVLMLLAAELKEAGGLRRAKSVAQFWHSTEQNTGIAYST